MIGGIDLLDRDGEGADGRGSAKFSSLGRIDPTAQQVEGLENKIKITFVIISSYNAIIRRVGSLYLSRVIQCQNS